MPTGCSEVPTNQHLPVSSSSLHTVDTVREHHPTHHLHLHLRFRETLPCFATLERLVLEGGRGSDEL